MGFPVLSSKHCTFTESNMDRSEQRFLTDGLKKEGINFSVTFKLYASHRGERQSYEPYVEMAV